MRLLERDESEWLDRYELVAELASGGMATVFLGRRVGAGGFQRFVAIKRLHPYLASQDEFAEMFLDEARLTASIHHTNVVPVLEVGTSRDGYYLVMEYIEGDTLARLMTRAATQGKRLPVPICIRIVLDALAGLHTAHDLEDDHLLLGLVHRDVSPQNILVGIDGTARIIDFGVAHLATRPSTRRPDRLKGKLAYMAPEQSVGEPLDRRADVFAIGTVLWEALANRRLFKGEGDADTLNRVFFEPIPRLADVDPSLARSLDDVVMKALSRDKNLRFPSAMAFARELEEAASSADLLASTREVAGYLEATMGEQIALQREAVRYWIGKSDSRSTELDDSDIVELSAVGTTTSPSTAPSVTTDVELESDLLSEIAQERLRKRKMRGALLVGALMGAGAWFVMPRGKPSVGIAPGSTSAVRDAGAEVAPLPTDNPP